MQLSQLLTTIFALGVSAAPNPDTKGSTTDNLARGWGWCNEGGYWFGEQCYCHQRNWGYCDEMCVWKCHEDAYWDYEEECCKCYNSCDYSEEIGCYYQ